MKKQTKKVTLASMTVKVKKQVRELTDYMTWMECAY